MKRLQLQAIVLGILVLCLTGIGLFAPYLVPNDPNATNVMALKLAPCAEFPFGTDLYGRCVFSRVLSGATISIFSAIVLVLLTFVFGTAVGMIAGYYGGYLDNLLMRFVDLLLSIPQMVLAIAVAGILGGTMINAMIALGITGWTLYARLSRSRVMALKEEPFIYECRLIGCSDVCILFRHLLPNIIGTLIAHATVQIGTTMMEIAGLSFLGIGVMPPQAEWGSMMNEARAYMQVTPWAVLAPAGAMVVTVIIFHWFGDTIRDLMDEKTHG